jgi:hypothetical protein
MARWQVPDRYGNQIYMTDERWSHALEKRPWLNDYFEDALDTIRYGRREQDALNPRKYKYYRSAPTLQPEYNHLVVVVLFSEIEDANGKMVSNNYVVNVWAVFLYGKR